MCGIVGSYDGEALVRMYRLNAARGNGRWTMACITPDYEIDDLICGATEASDDELRGIANINQGKYMILHVQESGYLWHNGIIKDHAISTLQKVLNVDTKWDTALLEKMFDKTLNDYDWLGSIDGSFACLRLERGVGLFAFRNAICPLFFDESLNISSSKARGLESFTSGAVYSLNLKERTIQLTDSKFTTFDMPYYIPGGKA